MANTDSNTYQGKHRTDSTTQRFGNPNHQGTHRPAPTKPAK